MMGEKATTAIYSLLNFHLLVLLLPHLQAWCVMAAVCSLNHDTACTSEPDESDKFVAGAG